MADFQLATASQVEKWDAEFFAEYVRENWFKPMMGTGVNAVIQTKYELTEAGKAINIPLVTRLTGAGVTGSTALEGAEEALGNYNYRLTVDWRRNGVLIPKSEAHWTEMDIRKAGRDMLKLWCMDKLRNDLITALGSINGIAYGSAAEVADKDAWLAANSDRVLFGDAIGNGGYTDHSADLATITSGMTLGAAEVSLMKRIAKTADPHIRPMRVQNDMSREFFVLFTDSRAFRDLKGDSAIATANREARVRGVDSNPVFQDGDLIYDGVIIKEVPEIASLGTVGNGGTVAVSPAYLCGAQALCVAWGQEPRSTIDVRDYKFRYGVGIEECLGVGKVMFNDKQHGMVTGYFAAAADA